MKAIELMEAFHAPVLGIVHVGANDGAEREAYRESGAATCLYVEPVEAVFKQLEHNIQGFAGHSAVRAVCSDTSGEIVRFNVANNSGESSSLFGLGRHQMLYPKVQYTNTVEMETVRLDDLLRPTGFNTFDLVVIDTQGADLKVLRGASELLRHVSGIFIEVSEDPIYEGGCTFDEITTFLRAFDIRLKWAELNDMGWGNAFYLKSIPLAVDLPTYDGNKAIGRPASQSSLSVYSSGARDAEGAVNGVKTGSFGFHTDVEDTPWWQVDLETVQALREVRVYNRIDAVRERSRRLIVELSSDGASWREVHRQGVPFGGIDGYPLRVSIQGCEARFIRLRLPERTSFHLDEVEVY